MEYTKAALAISLTPSTFFPATEEVSSENRGLTNGMMVTFA